VSERDRLSEGRDETRGAALQSDATEATCSISKSLYRTPSWTSRDQLIFEQTQFESLQVRPSMYSAYEVYCALRSTHALTSIDNIVLERDGKWGSGKGINAGEIFPWYGNLSGRSKNEMSKPAQCNFSLDKYLIVDLPLAPASLASRGMQGSCPVWLG